MSSEVELLVDAIWKGVNNPDPRIPECMRRIEDRLRKYWNENQDIAQRDLIDRNLDALKTYRTMKRYAKHEEIIPILREVYGIQNI